MNTFPAFEQTLDQALDRLAAGQPAAAILAHYSAPAYPASFAPALAPLLRAAELAQAGLVDAPIPPPDLARGRRRFLLAAAQASRRPALGLRPALALALVLVVIGLAALVPWASASALPGEALYPVKLAVEAAQLALTSGPTQRQRLTDDLAERRREEAARLLALGRETTLAFEGSVETVQADRLVISGLTVLTKAARAFNPGDRVAVEARTRPDGTLSATRIRLLAAAPIQTATPARSATPSAPRPTATAAPTLRPVTPTRVAPSEAPARPTASPSAIRPADTQRPGTATEPLVTQRPEARASETPGGRP